MKKYWTILLLLIVFVLMPDTINAQEQPTYRALFIGNANYYGSRPLNGPYNDLVKMKEAFDYNYFGKGNKPFDNITLKFDLNKSQIIQSIGEEFRNNKEGDVSYFYYSGHGSLNPYNGLASLMGVDGLGISVIELELELRKVPGTVIVILDSCNSGGFINKSFVSNFDKVERDSNDKNDDLIKFNDSIISAFSQRQSRSYLVGEKYKVITSSSKYESSLELSYSDGWGWGGEFTRAFVRGLGYNNMFLADLNSDNIISLDEIYKYSKKKVLHSSVQVYPFNDDFAIGSKFGLKDKEDITLWDTYKDVSVNKIWKVEFNNGLDDISWRNKINILDQDNKIFKTTLTKSSNGKVITVSPTSEYNYASNYNLLVERGITSESGSKLNKSVLVPFITEKKEIDYELLSLDIVQNGYFNNYPYPTVKEAFNHFFTYPTWDYFYSTSNDDIVEFEGIAYRGDVLGIVTLQFVVDVYEGSFKVEYAAFDDNPMTYYEFEGLLDKIYSSYLNNKGDFDSDIESIFSEKSSLSLNAKSFKD